MIKKFFIYFSLFLVTSCSDPDNVTISKEEYHQLKGTKKSEYPKSFHFKNSGDFNLNWYDWAIVLGEDNHEYLTSNGGDSFAIMHYPDCKKCLSRDTLK